MKEILILSLLASQLMIATTSMKTYEDKFRPPGTVEIVENFFIDEGEIRNQDWREYLSDLKETEGEDSELYKQALPNTKVWLETNPNMSPMEETYLWHPAYNDYPVVGISHQQAVDYCKWRTKAVVKMIARNGIDGPQKFEYRLPTQTEWELVANFNFSRKQERIIEKKERKDGKKTRLYNMRYTDYEVMSSPAPTISYLPNKYGIFNLHGNVAEMIEEPGVAMGGSFNHYYKDIVPVNKSVEYDCPKNWLGFRCVCEIIED